MIYHLETLKPKKLLIKNKRNMRSICFLFNVFISYSLFTYQIFFVENLDCF